MRSDAKANRIKLLNAAEVVFMREGAHVPLQKIAEQAGVGRGTLYRHFPDRISLIVAVFTERISRLISIGEDGTPAHLIAENILKETLDIQKSTPGLTQLIMVDNQPLLTELSAQSQRLELFLEQPIQHAIAAQRIYPGVTARDFLVSWAMFEGATGTYVTEAYQDHVTRARQLILRSILTPNAMVE